MERTANDLLWDNFKKNGVVPNELLVTFVNVLARRFICNILKKMNRSCIKDKTIVSDAIITHSGTVYSTIKDKIYFHIKLNTH
jgi:hypothetical protein